MSCASCWPDEPPRPTADTGPGSQEPPSSAPEPEQVSTTPSTTATDAAPTGSPAAAPSAAAAVPRPPRPVPQWWRDAAGAATWLSVLVVIALWLAGGGLSAVSSGGEALTS